MSTLATNAITDASGGNTASINGYTPTMSNMAGRNRIINGDMRIAQRGTSAVTTTASYPVDRFFVTNTTDGAFSAQQDSSAPDGFKYSTKFTVTSADTSLVTTQFAAVRQNIEGYNIADFDFGSSATKTITLSFWVKSSVTGTFGGAIRNGDANRSYIFTYSISSADTWEKKSVTIAGDTTGTWYSTNGIGFQLVFCLGAGPDRSGNAAIWSGSNLLSADGATNLMATNGATFYITGVQLEEGSVATPFEHRQYGTELALCQRYCQVLRNTLGESKIVPGMAMAFSTSAVQWWPTFYVPMRSAPSLTYNDVAALASFSGNLENASTALATSNVWEHNVRVNITTSNQVQYNPCKVYLQDGYWVAFTAEL